MKISDVDIARDIQRIEAERADYENADNRLLANMAFQVFLIREFENALLNLSEQGCVHGPVHTSIGQEASAVGAMAALEAGDSIASTHRAHHHYLAKAVSFYHAGGFDVLADGPKLSDKMQHEVTTLMGEIMGLSIGCCGGRGGSMHLRNAKIGVIGTNAIVAGGVPLATGAAFAAKYSKRSDVVVCFLGDGAVNQGAFHEALNLAGVWKLPAVYVIENNRYAVATSAAISTATEDLAVKALAYGIKGMVVDGMDAMAMKLAVGQAVERARAGDGATLIEAKCYRHLHHAGPKPGSAFGYRQKAEEDTWLAHDPCKKLPAMLTEYGIVTAEQVEFIRGKAVKAVDDALDHCAARDGDTFAVREELRPDAASVTIGLRSDGSELAEVKYNEIEDFSDLEQSTYVNAIASVIGRHMDTDDRVFVVGEEVASFGGGAYQATKGLPAKYPDRVLNTPISECGFTGLGGGAAMSGLKPIVEIMFPDFALVAADQLFNQIGKLRHMYGNTVDMPIVVRTRVAAGCGYGGQHSGDPVGIFSLFSGWRIVAPSNAFDYIGLFNTAMRSKDPILMLEHHELYTEKFDVPKGDLDYFVPFGKAKVIRQGSDVTVLCYSSMVGMAKDAAEQLANEGVDVEIVDLRTVSPTDIDYETVGTSFRKTKAIAVVEQVAASHTIGSYIANECQKRFFDFLDGPIATLAGLDIPNPVSKNLEATAMPNIEQVKETIAKAARHQL